MHLIPDPTCRLQDVAKLEAQLDLGDHVADGRGLRIGPRRRKHLRLWAKLLIKEVVRQLRVTVMLVDHVGQSVEECQLITPSSTVGKRISQAWLLSPESSTAAIKTPKRGRGEGGGGEQWFDIRHLVGEDDVTEPYERPGPTSHLGLKGGDGREPLCVTMVAHSEGSPGCHCGKYQLILSILGNFFVSREQKLSLDS